MRSSYIAFVSHCSLFIHRPLVVRYFGTVEAGAEAVCLVGIFGSMRPQHPHRRLNLLPTPTPTLTSTCDKSSTPLRAMMDKRARASPELLILWYLYSVMRPDDPPLLQDAGFMAALMAPLRLGLGQWSLLNFEIRVWIQH